MTDLSKLCEFFSKCLPMMSEKILDSNGKQYYFSDSNGPNICFCL